jgi:hypothetical protein
MPGSAATIAAQLRHFLSVRRIGPREAATMSFPLGLVCSRQP